MAQIALFTRFCALIALSLLLSAQLAHGQSSTTSSSATIPSSTSNAAIYLGNSKWEYHGCYNETTEVPGTGGARALAGGEPDRSDTMTVQSCLDICSSKSAMFAGLEYTRECFCAQYLNSLAAKLPDEQCNLECMGNNTQFCGGALKLSVYTVRKAGSSSSSGSGSKGAGVKSVSEAPVGSILALGVAMGMMLWLA